MGRLESSKRNVSRGRFIGRARELEGLAEKVRPGAVVTVVGPPGVGKTRLAREFARSEADRREVLLCDFSEAFTDEEVVTVLVRALGADVAASASYDSVLATIGRALSGKENLLLLLDNFEHLTRFSGLVRRSAELGPAVLVTSREPLALPGEVVFELAPLLAGAESETGGESDATQLFLECFRMQNPGHQPTEAELDVVRQLTARLEGLPLSIVLAASALKPPITADLRELPASVGQSLEETIEVSWNLLDPEEQRALAECSMFRGSFEERPASQVLSRPDGGTVDAYRLLHGLARKSLLSIQYVGPTAAVERGPGDSDRPSLLGMRRRFQMLSSIRDFASKRLAMLGDEPAMVPDARGPTRAHRFAGAYADLAREAAEIEMGLDAREAKDLLEHDVDNLSLAHRLAIERGLAEPAVEVALGIALVISGRAPLTRTLSLLDAAIAAADDAMESIVAVRAWIGRARLLELMGRAGEALASARQAREIAEGLGDSTRQLRLLALDASAKALLQLGRWREAREATEEAARGFEEAGMPAFAARASVTLGDTWFYEDDLERSDEAFSRALQQASIVGESGTLGLARFRKALVDQELGRFVVARAGYENAILAFRAAGDRGGEASATCYLAVLAQEQGELDVARAQLETLVVTTRELGKRRQQGIALLYLGPLLIELGDLPQAVATLELAERVLGEVGVVSAEAFASGWRAVALAMSGDVDAAEQALTRARTVLHTKREQAFYLGCVELFEGHLDLAHAVHAAATGDTLAAEAHRAQASERLAHAPRVERMQSDLRLARRILAAALGEAPPSVPRREVPAQAARPLVLERSAAWFRPPDGDRVDIETRAPLRKLVLVLADARLKRPGVPVAPGDLMREVWTDTRDVSALQNRLRVGIATLRKLGLAKVLFTRPAGYLLSPEVALLLSDGKTA
jgi:tetratricopeptide (TPR) repeat protein